ncbi:hypothetical protein ACJJTC_007642 [Scirpophaga incertulas]
MEITNDRRLEDLLSLQSFIGKVDSEITMILQHLQWDRNSLIQKPKMVKCSHNTNHKIPVEAVISHEDQCYLRSNGYEKKTLLFPDSASHNGLLVNLDKNDIQDIINNAAKLDPSFKRGTENSGVQPLTLERLQSTYTVDERRAIYDAVVKSAPSCPEDSDLALPSDGSNDKNAKEKSLVELLAERRDMKRRRTKYRVAAKTRNYSDILRDVIKSQMEVYSEVQKQHSKETLLKNQNESRNEQYRENPKQCKSRDSSSNHKHKRDSPIKNNAKQDEELDDKDTNVSKRKYESEYTDKYYNKNRHSRPNDESRSKSSYRDRKRHNEEYERSSDKRYSSSKRRYQDDKRTNEHSNMRDNDFTYGAKEYSFDEIKSNEYNYKYRHHSNRSRDETKAKSREVYKFRDDKH